MLYDHWRFPLPPADENRARQWQQTFALHPVVGRLLAQLPLPDEPSVRRFLHPDSSLLHDPLRMAGMPDAVDRLSRAVDRGEHILLYGDYDVDGLCGVALCYRFLRAWHPHLHHYIPRRDTEGYGFGQAGVDYAAARNCSLIITVDCGVCDAAAIEAAAARGIDVLVCDHHLPPATLPAATAVLDPLRPGCPYPFKGLSGCGVAFKLLQGLCARRGLPEAGLLELVDLVALSVACDLSPMHDENRVFVHLGLQRLNRAPRTGLRALLRHCAGTGPLDVRELVYRVGPLLNAAGRMGDATDALRLLLTDDREAAQLLAGRLAWRNKCRREADYGAFAQACARWEQAPGNATRSTIVLHDPDWAPGVLGIVAGRMAERYHKPAVLLAGRADACTGSARAIRGVSLDQALAACAGQLTTWGGHTHAAGLRLAEDRLAAFADTFEQAVRAQLPAGAPRRVLDVAAELPLADVSPELANDIERLAPFGPAHRSPVFVARNVRLDGPVRRSGRHHAHVALRQGDRVLQAVGFNLADTLAALGDAAFDVAYGIRCADWHGHRLLQLQIKDVGPRHTID
ncbi:MAG: single-stranded-DNA-specific exonuclease RecJ [Saprospiraceae bacterium]|nr:single-stranded-DNA-specific exonuclease RecJ [Saprospiraceae bacterium]